jgi:hypothetical protein
MNAIRRLVPLVALLPLAGCVLAIGNTPDDEGATGKRLKSIEQRLGALEKKCGVCEMGDDKCVVIDGKAGAFMPMGGKARIVIVNSDTGGKRIIEAKDIEMEVEEADEKEMKELDDSVLKELLKEKGAK